MTAENFVRSGEKSCASKKEKNSTILITTGKRNPGRTKVSESRKVWSTVFFSYIGWENEDMHKTCMNRKHSYLSTTCIWD